MTTTAGAGGYVEPTNRAGRSLFAKLSAADQDYVRSLSARLYDGTRTVSGAWSEALAEAAGR